MIQLAGQLSRLHVSRAASIPSITVRSYATEEFDIGKYLKRIEEISKKPTSRPRNPTRGPAKADGTRTGPLKMNARGAQNGQRLQGASASTRPPRTPRDQNRTQENPTGEVSAREPRTPRTPRTLRQVRTVQAREAPQTTETSAANTTWDSLDSSDKPTPALSRGSRRASPSLRKVGSRGKRTMKASAKKPQRRVNNAPPQDVREYQPFLQPQEALDIMMRNVGTTKGGFIGPIDVSLSSLQPNFVPSAVTYNSRVRSLINSVPPSVVHDRELLESLIQKHVAGSYSGLIPGDSLNSQNVASEINANRTIQSSHRELFAQIVAGKLTPRQIAQKTAASQQARA